MYVCMYICTYVRTVDDVMAIKPNFQASMAYQYFLSYGARRTRARSSTIMYCICRYCKLFSAIFLQCKKEYRLICRLMAAAICKYS